MLPHASIRHLDQPAQGAGSRHAARHFHENSTMQSRQSVVGCRKPETGRFYRVRDALEIAAAGAAFGQLAHRLAEFAQAGADLVDLALLVGVVLIGGRLAGLAGGRRPRMIGCRRCRIMILVEIGPAMVRPVRIGIALLVWRLEVLPRRCLSPGRSLFQGRRPPGAFGRDRVHIHRFGRLAPHEIANRRGKRAEKPGTAGIVGRFLRWRNGLDRRRRSRRYRWRDRR